MCNTWLERVVESQSVDALRTWASKQKRKWWFKVSVINVGTSSSRYKKCNKWISVHNLSQLIKLLCHIFLVFDCSCFCDTYQITRIACNHNTKVLLLALVASFVKVSRNSNNLLNTLITNLNLSFEALNVCLKSFYYITNLEINKNPILIW